MAITTKRGIQKAINLGFDFICIEGDCLSLINVVKDCWSCPWKIEMIIINILFDLRSFQRVQIGHIFREVNRVADRIAHLGLDYPAFRSLSSGSHPHDAFCCTTSRM